MYVSVLSMTGNRLMPTDRGGRVRYLLDHKLAKIVKMKPFTIQLLYETEDCVQNLYGGTDPGRTNISNSVMKENGDVVYVDHVETRNKEIPKLMSNRAAHRSASRQGERKRRQRRARKCGTVTDPPKKPRVLPRCEKPIENHYIINTEARFANRKRPQGWLTPTATQLLRTHLNMVDKICGILPVTDWTLEVNRFSFMKMEDGTIFGADYQNGRLKGFRNAKEYVWASQGGVCPCCGKPIECYHHIREQSKNGFDGPENLVGLCKDCHAKIHTRGVRLCIQKIGREKKYAALSVLNQIMPALYQGLVDRFGEDHVHICSGYDTKAIRERSGLLKDHPTDAMCIASVPLNQNPVPGHAPVYEVKQYRRHDRAIINNQRERTYMLVKKVGKKVVKTVVAKNRKARFEQEGPSLEDYLNSLPPEDRRRTCSRLTVVPSKRYYNDPKRKYLPGCIFLYKGKRYVMSGQLSGGRYIRAEGDKKTNYKVEDCRFIQTGGLVYL